MRHEPTPPATPPGPPAARRPDTDRVRPGQVPVPASVAICAYTMRRWADLGAAVASIVAQLGPDDECLVVIDHNDELLARATEAFAGYERVRVLPNAAERGLSGARNTAIAHSHGQLLAFLDDDATASASWLREVRDAFADPDVYGAGTAAVPNWSTGARPGWLAPEFDWVVGCTYRGLPVERSDVRNVIGAAMAFRREVFDLAGTFSTVVGRIGTAPTGCEETELCIRLRQAKRSARILYLPDVEVAHHVTADRLRVGYFLRRCFGEGQSKSRVSRLVGAGDGLSSERSYMRSVLPRAVLRELRRALGGQPAGLGAATLIVLGVFTAGLGYLQDWVAVRIRLPRARSRPAPA